MSTTITTSSTNTTNSSTTSTTTAATTATTTTSISRQTQLKQLTELVDSFLRDVERKDFKQYMDIVMNNYANYKDCLKKRPIDYKAAFLNYNIAHELIVKVIPTSSGFKSFVNSSSKRKRDIYDVYKNWKQTIINDDSYLKTIVPYYIVSSKGLNEEEEEEDSNIFINVQKLYQIDKYYPDDLLIIDYRPKNEFNKSHLDVKNIINIEPISVRSNYKDFEVENNSMITSNNNERQLFHNRSKFKYLVIYDFNSTMIDIMDEDDSLTRLFNSLTKRAFDQPLTLNNRSSPLILYGGLKAWIEKFALSKIVHQHGELKKPMKSLNRSNSFNFNSNKLNSNLNEYLSRPNSVDFNQHQKDKLYNQTSRLHQISISRPNSSQPSFLLSSSPIPKSSSFHKSVQTPFQPFKPSSSPIKYNDVESDNPLLNPTNINATLIDLHCTTGLQNLGNSCYMNSIIQCLLGTPPLFKMFLQGDYKQHININNRLGSKGLMTNSFSKLAFNIYNHKNSVVQPLEFKRSIGVLSSQFKNFDQQDSSEFLSFVLDTLHEDLNTFGSYPKLKELSKDEEQEREKLPIRLASTIEWERYLKLNFSSIVDLFQGQYSSQLKCSTCGTTSTTFQSFTTLSLPIPENLIKSKIDLYDCFNEFTKSETLDDEDSWNCPHCKKKVKTFKKITITRLPKNLIVHLKRFDPNLSKINKFVDYSKDLDLTSYWPTISSDKEREQIESFPPRDQSPPFKYSLYGVSMHMGNFSNGHYTSYVWKGTKDKWCYFDDSRIVKNCKVEGIINSNAYVLFYART
ncbi:hypothetical protein WICMUC_005958 [Wickerhamomyces mucosus]|uniref:Ubiquitin carboxyl-terminal hydrolase n=1 Tax=Wickerhamomyces mucosus TaxID=1378264 RepID=A0A9P8P262_9ASCO|nr:hypothetical protein WICMUC_005958 [Wickerhamomyces mucosus]